MYLRIRAAVRTVILKRHGVMRRRRATAHIPLNIYPRLMVAAMAPLWGHLLAEPAARAGLRRVVRERLAGRRHNLLAGMREDAR